MRKSKQELQNICARHNVNRIWSWSRINCYLTSKYEYYLKYVEGVKEDVNNCAYAPMGSVAHELLEGFYTGVKEYNDMIKQFEDMWLANIEIANLKFDRNDSVKNETIKLKYLESLRHFFSNHNPIEERKMIEQFILIKIDNKILLHGYIDIILYEKDGTVTIGDFKTSTIYKGKKALKECGQLVLYAIGVHQLGVPLEKIKIGWNFLKYQRVNIEQKNKKIISREIGRHEIGEKLRVPVTKWLKHYGYEDNLEHYILRMVESNSVEHLPSEVKRKFSFEDCWVYVPLRPDLIMHWSNLVKSTVEEITNNEEMYRITNDINYFWDDFDKVKDESFYFSTLCGYSANLHLPYKSYLEKLEADKNESVFCNQTNISKLLREIEI